MGTPLTRSDRRTVSLALILFALSMLLPAYRVWPTDAYFIPGYHVAWFVEFFFWGISWESIKMFFGTIPVSQSNRWSGWELLLPGAMANHLFLLAFITVLFRRFRMAVFFSTLSAACAIGWLLPGQAVNFSEGWHLGPGYFVWFAATVVLAIATWRVARRELKSQPLFDGILTSRKINSSGHDNSRDELSG